MCVGGYVCLCRWVRVGVGMRLCVCVVWFRKSEKEYLIMYLWIVVGRILPQSSGLFSSPTSS